MVKRLVCTVLAVLLLIGAASCSQTESPAESAASSKSLKESLLPATPSAVSSPESNISQKLPPSSQEESSDSAESGGSSESSGQAEQGQVVTITFPEGESLTEIFAALEENGVSTFDELMSMAENYDYSYYPLVAAAPSSGRCFRLEGYLFPDTYDFYVGEKPQDAIGRFLRNSEARITDSYRQRAAEMGYSMDQILTIASLIQREGSNPDEVANIAAVIYNRLNAGMQLEMDATITYIESDVIPYFSGDIDPFRALYNTYKCPALPAGPICNPGLSTIEAALYPSDVPYLYFCHDASDNYYYASTYEEHQQNLQKAGIG